MIKEITQSDLQKALNLVNGVFDEFVAVDYSEQGRQTFENYLKTKYEETAAALADGSKKFWGFYQDGEILGVIAVRNVSHISMLFVDKKHHGKGIAKRLFHFLLDYLKDAKQITVNSSPYAVKIYERLGFSATTEQQEKDGLLFTPMIYRLD